MDLSATSVLYNSNPIFFIHSFSFFNSSKHCSQLDKHPSINAKLNFLQTVQILVNYYKVFRKANKPTTILEAHSDSMRAGLGRKVPGGYCRKVHFCHHPHSLLSVVRLVFYFFCSCICISFQIDIGSKNFSTGTSTNFRPST